jgi:hypothetical protein
MAGRELHDEVAIADGRGAEHDTLGAEAKGVLGGLDRSDAAADLNARAERLDDSADKVGLRRAPGAGALEVHDVEAGAAAAETGGEGRGGAVVNGDAIVAALVEADGMAVEEIDGGEEMHADGVAQGGAAPEQGCPAARPP